MPSVGLVTLLVLVIGTVVLDLFPRYLAPAETLTVKIVDKRAPGFPTRKTFLITVRTPAATLECGIAKAGWDRTKPGEFARVTIAWRQRFIQRLEPLAGLRPEEKIRLEKMLENE